MSETLYPYFSFSGSEMTMPKSFPTQGKEFRRDCCSAVIAGLPFSIVVPKVPSHEGVTCNAPNMALSKPNMRAPRLKMIMANHAYFSLVSANSPNLIQGQEKGKEKTIVTHPGDGRSEHLTVRSEDTFLHGRWS